MSAPIDVQQVDKDLNQMQLPTSSALGEALATAQSERDALVDLNSSVEARIADLERMIDTLQTLSGTGTSQASSGNGAANKKAPTKRSTQKSTAKKAAKSTAKKASAETTTKKTAKKSTRKKSTKATRAKATRSRAATKSTAKKATKKAASSGPSVGDRAVKILEEAGRPLSNEEIATRLDEAKVEFDNRGLAGAINGFVRSGRLVKNDDGKYRLGDPGGGTDTADADPTATTDSAREDISSGS